MNKRRYAVLHNNVWDVFPTLFYMDGNFTYVLTFHRGEIVTSTTNFKLYEATSTDNGEEWSEWKLIQG
jgi:hypothetical protein